MTSVLKPLLAAATRTLDEAVETHPLYADYRYHRANCLAGLGCAERAGEDLDVALEVNPKYGAAVRLRRAIEIK